MTAELSTEQVVTNLLASNDIIRVNNKNFYITNPALDTLGDFLLDIDEEIPVPEFEYKEPSRFVFITK